MKQLFYAIAVVVLLFLAVRLMAKIKDVPEEGHEQDPPENNDEIEEEDADVIANRKNGE